MTEKGLTHYTLLISRFVDVKRELERAKDKIQEDGISFWQKVWGVFHFRKPKTERNAILYAINLALKNYNEHNLVSLIARLYHIEEQHGGKLGRHSFRHAKGLLKILEDRKVSRDDVKAIYSVVQKITDLEKNLEMAERREQGNIARMLAKATEYVQFYHKHFAERLIAIYNENKQDVLSGRLIRRDKETSWEKLTRKLGLKEFSIKIRDEVNGRIQIVERKVRAEFYAVVSAPSVSSFIKEAIEQSGLPPSNIEGHKLYGILNTSDSDDVESGKKGEKTMQDYMGDHDYNNPFSDPELGDHRLLSGSMDSLLPFDFENFEL